jgi:hypothetical protein
MNFQVVIIWVVMPCNDMVGYNTLKVVAAWSSETLVSYIITRRHKVSYHITTRSHKVSYHITTRRHKVSYRTTKRRHKVSYHNTTRRHKPSYHITTRRHKVSYHITTRRHKPSYHITTRRHKVPYHITTQQARSLYLSIRSDLRIIKPNTFLFLVFQNFCGILASRFVRIPRVVTGK